MMNSKKRTNLSNLSPEIIKEIKDKRKKGMTINILCFTYQMSHASLYKILKS